MRILSIFGTRPEAVKMAPVVLALREDPQIESLICVTAQHRQMLDQVLRDFQIQPDFDLNLMREDQSLAQVTSAILTNLDPLLKQVQPDWVLVQGDTATVMSAALLAYYHRIKIGHVEAGLRTGDKWQPFPEEINRRITGVIADLHFAPTERARQNLLSEGIPPEIIRVTGNTAIDAVRLILQKPEPLETKALIDKIGLNKGPARLVVVTAHRRENFGEPLRDICHAIKRLAETYGDRIRIVYPVHLNPHVQGPVKEILSGLENVFLIPPMDYLPFVHLWKRAYLIMTDSGGIQEEAPGLGIPVLVLRDVTERPEGVEAGTLKLVGTVEENIYNQACRLLDDPEEHASMAKAVNPFGDGYAAERIVQSLK